MKNLFSLDRPQINESYLLKDNLNILLIIRILLFLLVNFFFWAQIYQDGESRFQNIFTNLQFLTLWGLNFINFYFLFAIIDMIHYKKTKKNFKSFWKVEHAFFQIGFSCQLTIFLLFWVGVYPGLSQYRKEDQWYMINTVFRHGGVILCAYIEMAVNNIDFKWKHYYLTLITSILYILLNLVVTLTYRPAYKILTWKSAMSYGFIAAAIIITFLHFAFGKLLYDKVKSKYIVKQVQTLPIEVAKNPEIEVIKEYEAKTDQELKETQNYM